MSYTPYYPVWEDEPDTDTPITAAALNNMEAGIVAANALTSIEYENAWSAPAAYTPGDVVVHDGVEYLAVNPSTGQPPPAPASAAPLVIGMGVALPSMPFDGQEFILVDSLTAPTFSWRFRYVAAKASDKWVFIGGAPTYAEVTPNETTTSTAFTDLGTVGPSIVVPRAGLYEVEIGCHMYSQSGPMYCYMSYDIGATPAAEPDAIWGGNTLNVAFGSVRKRRKSLTAVTLTAKYNISGGGTGAFERRWMSLLPVAVS